MSSELTGDSLKQERELMDSVRKLHPEMLERLEPPDQNLILGKIGVTFLSNSRPKGYLRLYPQDFIVQEVMKDGTIVPLVESQPFQDAEDRRTLWADLIKACISHPHAMTDLQRAFNLDAGQVGYAGIKDAVALTSQRITLRGVTREQAEALSLPQMEIRPTSYGSGALQPSDLMGNRFTLVVRTQSGALRDDDFKVLQEKGFLNFFGSQRFGSRLVSHKMGQKLLQGDIDGALLLFFGEVGPFDVPLFRDIRQGLTNLFGDWDAMESLVSRFPHTLHNELKVLRALKRDPRKTKMALGEIRDQVKMWIYAYGSWLVNRRMSQAAERGETLPETIPLPLNSKGPIPDYEEFMKNDQTLDYLAGMRAFPYVLPADKPLQVRMKPEGLRWKQIPQGYIVRFALGKGAYATSFLSHLFQLYESRPVPEWVQKEEVDSFVEMGDGSLEKLKERFAPILVRRDVLPPNKEEEEIS